MGCTAEREAPFLTHVKQVRGPGDEGVGGWLTRPPRYISKDGAPLEAMIKEREAANPKYKCLSDPTCPEANYYRWKV